MSNEQYQAQGPGRAFLAYPALQFLLTTDPFLGTTVAGVPDGPFNRELHKLLQNDAALANLFSGYLSRTYGSSVSAAPVVGAIPDPLANAPTTPANLAMHTVFYSDYEVVYTYDGTNGVWVEQARMARVSTAFTRNVKTLSIALTSSVDNIVVGLPTIDDNAQSFDFSISDLKCFYVRNENDSSPFISAAPGISLEDDTLVRFVFSSAPITGSDYHLVVVFENVTLL